ncbi:MAG TPA: hypothetical protein VNT30_08135 [Stellaceae bacterium]|nr:hypothetical protein [Stellaceae bacterium]
MARSRSVADYFLVGCFFVLLAIPGGLQLIGAGTIGTQENRVLAAPPQMPVDRATLIALPHKIDAFLDDRFGLRTTLIRWNSMVRLKLGVSSASAVAIGRKHFLFYAYHPERLLEQHTGEDVYKPAELERWVATAEENRKWLAERGIAYYIVVAPDKSTIYPEYLPDYPPLPNSTTRLDQLVARLQKSPDLELIDPRQELRAAKAEHRIYPYADSHWGPRGAFIAYKMLMDRIRLRFPSAQPVALDNYDIKVEPTPGDLAAQLSLYDVLLYPEDGFYWRGKSHQLEVSRIPGKRPWGWPENHIKTDLSDKPRLLVQGDSFTDYVMGPLFLYETFKDPIYTHHNGTTLDYDLINETHPDIVVLEVAERYLTIP